MVKVTQLTKKQKVITGVIIGIVILLLFALWWYGFYPEIGKSNDSSEIMQVDLVAETPEDRISFCKKEASRLSTETLLNEVLNTHPSGMLFYDTPEVAVDYEDTWNEEYPAGAAYKELLSRASTGRKLLNMYEDYTQIEDNGDFNELAKIEMLLAQPEVRRHLTPIDLSRLDSAIKEVQRAKYNSNFGYERRNFLFVDAYSKDGWDQDKLNEIASKYDSEFFDASSQVLFINGLNL